ncbi:flagellar basal body rod protein FlgC [Paracoccus ravus]|uniref:flagellar basal body rod protein FlgC n=1 Tax=Paracoccus ravus TaxID=2447760 RepID=UPI00106DDBE3|nr:flagellar basal body rod protein FlgC [Paracoccus ravus]
MDDITAITRTAASAMRAQSMRMRIVAENMANAESTGSGPGEDPFRRKVVTFETVLDEASGARIVEVSNVAEDPSPFEVTHAPSHPAADAAGNVKMPNVNPMIELANMREASRSFEANLNLLDAGRKMRSQLIELLV